MIDRLAEDHANARRLAEGIADMAGIVEPRRRSPSPTPAALDPARVATNFVLFQVERDRRAFLEALARTERADGRISRTARSGP